MSEKIVQKENEINTEENTPSVCDIRDTEVEMTEEEEKVYQKNSNCYAYFCVLNNVNKMEEYKDMIPMEILQDMHDKWVTEDHPERSCALAYCISASDMHHVHFDVDSRIKMRFSAVKKIFPKAHILKAQGTKKQRMDYIQKAGKFKEKGEKIVEILVDGELLDNEKSSSRSNVLDDIERLLVEENKTPKEIMAMHTRYVKHQDIIRKRYEQLLLLKIGKDKAKELKVYWHIGDPGSGKSYYRYLLAEQDKDVFIATDFENRGFYLFDGYANEPCVFIDDLKPTGITLNKLLFILDNKLNKYHARYGNILLTYNEIHITSVWTPKDFFNQLVDEFDKKHEDFSQLKRRIHYIVFHKRYGKDYFWHCEKAYTYFNKPQLIEEQCDKSYWKWKLLHGNDTEQPINKIATDEEMLELQLETFEDEIKASNELLVDLWESGETYEI